MIQGRGLVSVVLALLGALAAFGAFGRNLGDLWRAPAEADRIRAETAWQTQQHEAELPYWQAERAAESQRRLAELERDRQLLEAQTQGEVDRVQAEYRAAIFAIQAQHQADLEQQQRRQAVETQTLQGMLLLKLLAGFVLIMGAVVLIAQAVKLLDARQPGAAEAEPARANLADAHPAPAVEPEPLVALLMNYRQVQLDEVSWQVEQLREEMAELRQMLQQRAPAPPATNGRVNANDPPERGEPANGRHLRREPAPATD